MKVLPSSPALLRKWKCTHPDYLLSLWCPLMSIIDVREQELALMRWCLMKFLYSRFATVFCQHFLGQCWTLLP